MNNGNVKMIIGMKLGDSNGNEDLNVFRETICTYLVNNFTATQ
jgi:hypothetical protein